MSLTHSCFVSSDSDGLIKLWTIKTSECVKTMDEHTEKVKTGFTTSGQLAKLIYPLDVLGMVACSKSFSANDVDWRSGFCPQYLEGTYVEIFFLSTRAKICSPR